MSSIYTCGRYEKLSSLLTTRSCCYLLPYNLVHFSLIKKYLLSISQVPSTIEIAGDVRKNK